MNNWIFNPDDYKAKDFSLIPEGDHRVRINNVIEKTFRSGNQGFEITLDVYGHDSKVWYFLVLDFNDTKKTNQRIGAFFNSFGITDNNLANYQNWIGKTGAVRVVHGLYEGNTTSKVAFCLSINQQSKLPNWNHIEPIRTMNFSSITF